MNAHDEETHPQLPSEEGPASREGGAEAEAPASDALAELQAERDKVHEDLLRLAADYQNYVRRSGKAAEEARRQQTMEMSRALLTVLDHFDRALQVDPAKTSADSLLQGVQMVRDELLRTLERFGIRRLDARRGDAFNPNLHEALMHQPVEGLESQRVADQLQPGYQLGDTTLRPAKVTVTP